MTAEHNVAALHEAVAEAVGERECIVWRDRRLSWADVTDRTRRLADVLRTAGIGCRGSAVAPWESPHDHVALYLHNGNEYLEAMLGVWKARAAPVNVNYRYVAAELAHVLRDSRATAVVFHGTFAATLGEVVDDLPAMRLLVQVDDGSGAPLLPGAVAYEEVLAAARPVSPIGLVPDDRYILYTGGTTGRPKGVLWRQGDFLATCLGVTGTVGELVEAARRRDGLRALASAPFMHGAAHWNALSAWISGGTVVIQDDPTRMDPADVLAVCARERVGALQIVGDAFARPLLDRLAAVDHDLAALRVVLSGGAVLSAPVKARLLDALPRVRIVDVLGSSETGRQAVTRTSSVTGGTAAADGPGNAPGFTPDAGTVVLADDLSRRLVPGDPGVGWLAQRGRVPLGYLGDPVRTRATFPVVDGERHAVSGDRVRLRAAGRVELLGRDSVTINTGGEKVYAEEVEQALTAHPGVADAVVVGRPSERWGQEVVGVVAPVADVVPPSDDELRDHCRATIAGYKVPKTLRWVDGVRRSPAGKVDYTWARGVAGTSGADYDDGGSVSSSVV